MRLTRFAAALGTAAVFAAAAATLGAQAHAGMQPKPDTASAHAMVAAGDVTWGPAPPALPAGAQTAVLAGDPTKAGQFVIRVRFPDGYTVAPHWHPTDENVTVLEGTLVVGMGEKAEESAMRPLAAGSFVRMPKKAAHYVRAKGATVLQIHAMGPFELTYINPQDDPRLKKTQ